MSRFFTNFSDINLTLIGLFIFISLFIIFVGKTFLKSQKAIYNHLEKLPLHDDSEKN